uniref:uS3m n=1 Tax=Polytomella magna TaxID=353565 RepID=UPI00255C283D|nr:Chain Bc, uS3m [Polytomella magna]
NNPNPPQIRLLLVVQRERLRPKNPRDIELLSAEQTDLAKTLITPPTEEGAEPPAAPQLAGLKQVGLPLNQRDVVSVLHQSLSNAVGQNVHFRPFFFSNLFQSAPAVAQYVAHALETGSAWNRVERFFVSSVEGDPNLLGMQVQVKGRLGTKAGKGMKKHWKYGDLDIFTIHDYVDYGRATAFTRMGAIGVRVWLKYKPEAVKDVYFQRQTNFTMPLSKLLSMPRPPLPLSVDGATSSCWWTRPAPLQPPENLTEQSFATRKLRDPQEIKALLEELDRRE